ncbi:Ca2+:H+ antiporter [Cryomyces antarcticus]
MSDFAKKARQHSRRQSGNRPVSPMPRQGDGQTNSEATPLLGSSTLGSLAPEIANSKQGWQPWEDNRAWVAYPWSFLHKTWQVLISSPVNILLVFVPAGIVCGAIGANPTVVFVLNFLAIIPLAALLSFATEEISVKLGQTLGGLMNATFGNAVELIVSIVALKNGEIRIVQASMLGSILSNILLVLGCCFIAGGLNPANPKEQTFNSTVASTMSSLMAVATASLIIPATLYAALPNPNHSDAGDKKILLLSHGTSIILLILYVMYLYFQLKSHKELFDEEQQTEGGDGAEQEPAILSPWAAGVALVLVTVVVAVCAEYLVDSIDSIVQTAHISKTFIGLVLLPIVGNAAEHVTACVVAYKNKMDLAIGVAIGSSMQIALFVTPFLVILGWIIGQPMTLHFQMFETVVFFVSVLVVNYLIQDGKSNYLEGAMCLGTYIIIALAFYVYPDNAGDKPGPGLGMLFGGGN